MSETWEDATSVPPEAKALREAILALKITPELIVDRVERFRQRIKLDGFLPACGSCGIRHAFIDESSLHISGRRAAAADADDLYEVRENKPQFVRLGLDDPLIETLRLTEEQVKKRDDVKLKDYKEVFCAYDDYRGGKLKAVLHLHPPLVEPDPAGGEPHVIVCSNCLDYMRKVRRKTQQKKQRAKDTEANVRRAMARTLCIAEGHDYGNLLGCPELSLLEKVVIAQYVFYGQLIKLNAWKTVRQNALKGHIIAFAHTGPNAINRTSKLLFPWFQDSEMLQCVRVSFVGPRGVADRCLRALCLDSGLLRVDIVPLAWWLGLLQAVHPGYKHMQIPSQAEKDEIQVKLQQLQAKIIANAQLVHNKLSRKIEKRAGADIANVRCLPEEHDLDADNDIGSSSSSSSSSDEDDSPNKSKIPDGMNLDDEEEVPSSSPSSSGSASDDLQGNSLNTDGSESGDKLTFILTDTMVVDGSGTPEQNTDEIMSALLSMLQHNADNNDPPQASFRTFRSNEPINEWGNTDLLYYMALPCLFPFGRGLPEGSSALPQNYMRHLLLQYHNRHANDPRLYFSHLNMTQRHSASRQACIRVRNSKPIVKQFLDLIQEDNFILRLALAKEDPESDDAKLLARQVLPLITTMGSTIPYSPSERKDMFAR